MGSLEMIYELALKSLCQYRWWKIFVLCYQRTIWGSETFGAAWVERNSWLNSEEGSSDDVLYLAEAFPEFPGTLEFPQGFVHTFIIAHIKLYCNHLFIHPSPSLLCSLSASSQRLLFFFVYLSSRLVVARE